MRIIWDDLEEVKRFIDLVGLAKLCKDEKEWGGLGVNITGNDVRKDDKLPATESYTLHGPDYIIITPYYKELSWLFRNTYQYTEKGTLSGRDYQDGFWSACTIFFLQHKGFTPKNLLFFVIDFLANLEKNTVVNNEEN